VRLAPSAPNTTVELPVRERACAFWMYEGCGVVASRSLYPGSGKPTRRRISGERREEDLIARLIRELPMAVPER